MNLLETYSHFCGVTPETPFIDEEFYPIPFDKYVVIQASAGMQSKQYDMWEEVVESIKLPVVQIGGKDDQKLPVSLNLLGQTNWNQSASILRNASLFLGGDSVCNHIASALNVPRIALFGATSPKTCGGVWNKDTGIDMVPPDMMGCAAPCHLAECIKPKKCINSITPLAILNNAANVIGKQNVNPVEILHAGDLSKAMVIEWTPSSITQGVINTFNSIAGMINIRMEDCSPNLKELSIFCNQTPHKYIVIVPPMDLNDFSIHPSKIDHIMILVDKTNIKQGIELMKSLTKRLYRVRLVSRLDHAEFDEYKIEILNYPQIVRLTEFEAKEKENSWIGQKLNIKTTRRIIGKDGKIYLTLADAKKDQNSVEISTNNCYINIEAEHLKELNFLTIRKHLWQNEADHANKK